MEVIAFHPLIDVTQEDVKKARQFYDLDDVKRINESLDQIDEWCKKQPHLEEAHKYMSRNMLERIFILARGSVEGTKKKIDRLLTSRGMMPELSLHRTYDELTKYYEAVRYVPLPKLNPSDQSRVMVTQFLTGKLDQFSLINYFRYCFLVGEYRLNFDYSLSERYIIDLNNIHIGLLSKINPVVVKKAEVLCTEGFGTKIKGIHILNAPPFVDRLVFLLKQALREKVASRLHVHPTYEDLQLHIPKEVLPVDYGGEAPTCAKLAEQWQDTFRTDEAQKIIKNLDKLVTDESRRSSEKFNEEYLGMPGSFRKLDVD
ncbi:hypothetical protein O0L34_g14255 [Tuta absoluta]|nr:hypothetical protein O0L34_g1958 [Tuta absoluta]KAJ2937973.1 hypothetical protein O0L34_g14255 [Tuta absoluta]